MTTWQILLGLVISLIASECCEVSSWAADKLVRWSAHRRYAPPAWAEVRAEELVADRPGKLFKLITALGFAVMAGYGSHDQQNGPPSGNLPHCGSPPR